MNKVFGVIIGAAFIILCSTYLTSNDYDRDMYSVNLSNKKINFLVSEVDTKTYIPGLIKSNIEHSNWVISNKDSVVNILSLSDTNLEVGEYNCLNKAGGRRINCNSYYEIDTSPILSDSKVRPYRLVISKGTTTIYDGDYVSDISPYVNTSERYYFTVYLNTERDFNDIQTKLIFNVRFVGENNG